MICEKCGKEHSGTYGSGRFCNIKCANSRIISNDIKERISKKLRKYEKKFCKKCGKKLRYNNKTLLCKKCLYSIEFVQYCASCGIALNKENSLKKKNNEKFYSYCNKCLYEKQKRRWIERKKEAVEYKGGKCIVCGYNKCMGALEFHHVNLENKNFGWTKMRFLSEEKMFLELDKCILMCANCHREEHYGGIEQLDSSSLF